MGTWIFFVGLSVVGAAFGYIGFFTTRVEGWSGALIGAAIGFVAAAIQQAKDSVGTLGPKRAKREPVLATSGTTISPERNRRILRRRSISAKYSDWLFIYGTLALVFFGFAGLIAKPNQFWEVIAYGLVPLGLLGAGVFKRRAANREIARAMEVLQRGVVADAHIVSLDHKAIKDSKSPFVITLGWVATYFYRDSQGFEHEGNSGFLPRKEAERYHVGEAVTIVIDPADSAFSVWAEPCSLERSPMISDGQLPIV